MGESVRKKQIVCVYFFMYNTIYILFNLFRRPKRVNLIFFVGQVSHIKTAVINFAGHTSLYVTPKHQ